MLEHVAVRTEDYTDKNTESKQPVDYPPSAYARGEGRYLAPVRIKAGAKSAIKVYYGAGIMPPRYSIAVNNLRRSFNAQDQTLVYSRNPQDGTLEKVDRRKRSRPTAMSTHAKDIGRDSGAILKRDYGKKVLFLTLTVPGSTQKAMDTVAMESRDLMNSFLQYLRDYFDKLSETNKAGLSKFDGRLFRSIKMNSMESEENKLRPEYFFVWEPQKRGMLHVHLIMGFEDEAIYQHIRKHHRRWWRRVLENVSDRTGVDLFERAEGGTWRGVHSFVRTDMQKAKTDVEHYLVKYLQKTEGTQIGEKFLGPSKWWGISKALAEKVKAELKMEEITLHGEEYADEIAQELIALTEGKTVKIWEMKNKGTGKPCGKYIVLEEGTKDVVYAQMVNVLSKAATEKPKRGVDLFEWHGSVERVIERAEQSNLMFNDAHSKGFGS